MAVVAETVVFLTRHPTRDFLGAPLAASQSCSPRILGLERLVPARGHLPHAEGKGEGRAFL